MHCRFHFFCTVTETKVYPVLILSRVLKKILGFRERERKWGGRVRERERGREEEKHQFIVPLIYAFIG